MKKAYQLKQITDTPNQAISHQEKESVRVNKYLTNCGFCSRRKADEYIMEGRVTIDGIPAIVGTQVQAGQVVLVDGVQISNSQNHVYIALNKPTGITCTLEPDIEGNIADFMDYHQRIFPIGRLDKDSSGLIILTSDGDIVNKILRAENNHDKEYTVHVDQDITPLFLSKMATGVEITNMRTKTRVVTKECKIEQRDARTFTLILTQGLNRQIRRMCTELGYHVVKLQRERIMNIQVGDLNLGQWRYLTQEELNEINKMI